MLRPQSIRGLTATAAALLGILSACSNSNRSVPPTAATPTILASNPVDGAIDVEPDSEVTLDIALPVGGTPVGDITVTDGVNELPGTLAFVEGIRWRWTPAGELPRGSLVELRSLTQGRVAQFSVREANQERSYYLPGVTSNTVLTWPNGRSAVRADFRWWEVTPAGLAERFTELEYGASTFGDGKAVFLAQGAAWDERWLVRTGLDGERDRVLLPGTGGVTGTNAHGDVVLFVHAEHAGAGEAGLWVLWNEQLAWQRVAPLELPLAGVGAAMAAPQIDDGGAVSVTYLHNGVARFWRYERGSVLPKLLNVPNEGQLPQLGLSGDGRGWLAWMVSDVPGTYVLRAVRYEPSRGFGQPQDLSSWDVYSGPFAAGTVLCEGMFAARSGSAVAFVSVSPGGPSPAPGMSQYLRIEPDGWASVPASYRANFLQGRLANSRERGELWTVWNAADAQVLTVSRSQPGSEVEPSFDLYRVPDPIFSIASYGVGIDESGRSTIWTNEVDSTGTLLGTRIIVVE